MRRSILIVLLSLLLVSTASADLMSHLHAYYSFDDSYNDSSGNDRHLTNSNAGFTTGVIGSGVDFNSSASSYLYGSGVNVSNNSFTFSWWMNRKSGGPNIFSQRNFSASTNEFQMYRGTGDTIVSTLVWGSTVSARASSTDYLTQNQWNHYAISFNGTHTIYYRNGTQFNSATSADNNLAHDPRNFLMIGRDHGTGYSNMQIDEVAIWTRTLNATEIESVYGNGSGYNFISEPEPEPEYVEVVLSGSGSWPIPAGVTNVSVLMVGGGGGSGRTIVGDENNGGGGGSGGLVFIQEYQITKYGSSVTYSVGSGGAGSTSASTKGTSGGPTTFGNLTALGGGGGGSGCCTVTSHRDGVSGGSGGGGGYLFVSPTHYTGTGGTTTQTTTNDGISDSGFGHAGAASTSGNKGGGGGGAGSAASANVGGSGKVVWGVEYARGGGSRGEGDSAREDRGDGGRASNPSTEGSEAGTDGIIIIRYSAFPELIISALDAYDFTPIINFSATVNGTELSTTNGTIYTGIPTNDSTIIPVSASASGYFSYENDDVNASAPLVALLVQAYASFDCFQAYTNSSLACLQSGPLVRNADTFTDQVNVTGYYPVNYTYSLSALDNETYSVEGFYNYKVTLNASDYLGSALTNFTISVESDLVSFNTTDNNTGVVVLELLRGYEYNVTIAQNVPSGVDRNNSIETATFTDPFDHVGAYSESYQYNLTFPRLFINIYDEQTSLLVMTNTTVTFTKGESSFSTSTTSGTLNFTGINAIESGVYSVLFENANYNPRTYSLTYNRTYPQTLNAYIAPEAAPSTIFTIEDRETRNPIEGATVTIQRHVNGTLTTVLSRSSDITGRVGFDYIPDRRYEFTITKNGYALKSFSLDPILFSSYTVLLDPERQFGSTGADFSVISIVILQDGFTELRPNDISLSFSDPAGGLVRYGYNVSTTATGSLGSANGTNAYGSILPLNFEIPDVTIWDQVRVAYYYELSDGSSGSYVRTYSIDQITKYANQTWVSNRHIAEEIPVLDRAGIVVIATGAMTALAYTFAGLGGAAVSALFILGFFTYSGFINGWVLAVSIIGFLLLLFGRGSQ